MKYAVFSVYIFLFLSFQLLPSIELPDSFGKTHFIVGVDAQKVIKQSTLKSCGTLEEILKPTEHGIHHVLFAPDDDVLDLLKKLIEKEKTSIRMAAFLLTDYQIVKAIIGAKERGVLVEIVFDANGIRGKYAKIAGRLRSKGVDIFVYKSFANYQKPKLSNIMHNKFIVFGENIFGKPLLWTGSFNFTYSAHKVNQENIVILDDDELIKKFSSRFDYIRNSLCYVFGKKNKKKARRSNNNKKRA